MKSSIFVLALSLVCLIGGMAAEIAPLTPGTAWRVERLPADKSDASKNGTLLEENIMGADFRQQDFLEPDKLTRILKGKYVFVVRSDGTYDIDFISEEMAGGPGSPDRLSEFDWLKRSTPAGSETVDGVECDLYADPAGARRAAIGRADRKPRRLEMNGEIHRYSWSSAPPPTFPAGAASVLAALEEEYRQQAKRYAIPQ